ncbi:MAG: ABC transporter substrate-binding protein [Pseudomonadota bacterium]
MDRRTFLAVTAAAALPALPAWSLSASSAQALVQAAVTDINRVVNSVSSESQAAREFERIFSRYADVPNIARYTLGVEARSASASQLRSYTQVFQGYIARKYAKQFRDFRGGEVQVTGARAVNNIVEVTSVAAVPGQSPVEVQFLVRDAGGNDRIYNIFVEGVNLLLSERDEILAMLDARGGDLGRLTQDLRSLG